MIALLQESIDSLKNALVSEYISSSSSIIGLPSGAFFFNNTANKLVNNRMYQSTLDNVPSESGYLIDRATRGDLGATGAEETSGRGDDEDEEESGGEIRETRATVAETLSQTNIERVESIMPGYSVASSSSPSRLSRMSQKSGKISYNYYSFLDR